jgi:hypothetical protein
MNATDVKAVVLCAVHGSGQGLDFTQADIDARAAEYAQGKPLDVIVATILSTPKAIRYERILSALAANGAQSLTSLRALLGDPQVG